MRIDMKCIGTRLNWNEISIHFPLFIPRLFRRWTWSPQLWMVNDIVNIDSAIIAIIRHLIYRSLTYEVPSVFSIFGIGILVPVILPFPWREQVVIFGRARSIYLSCISQLHIVGDVLSICKLIWFEMVEYLFCGRISSVVGSINAWSCASKIFRKDVCSLSRAWRRKRNVFLIRKTPTNWRRNISHRDFPSKLIWSVECDDDDDVLLIRAISSPPLPNTTKRQERETSRTKTSRRKSQTNC